MFRKSLVLLVSLFLIIGSAGLARAQTNYPAQSTVEVRDANGNLITVDVGLYPGDPMYITAGGWLPGSVVTFTFHSDPILLGTKVVDPDGYVRAMFLVPNVEPGIHTLRMTGTGADGKPRVVDWPIRVLARPTSVGGATLDQRGTALGSAAGTGSSSSSGGAFGKTGLDNVANMVAVGFALLCVGGALVLAVRRSRRGTLA